MIDTTVNHIRSRLISLPYGQAILDYSSMSFSRFLQMALGFIKGFIVAKILGPTNFGTWKGVEVLQLYHQYSTLGTQNGLSREIPKLRGQGKLAQIEAIRSVAFGQIFTLPLLVSIIIAIYSFSFPKGLIRFGMLMTSANVMLLMGVNYFVRLMFADKRFVLYSKVAIVMSVIVTVFAVISAVTWKAKAPYITVFVTNILMVIVLIFIGKYRLKPVFSFSKSIHLIRIGFPIMMVGLLYGLLTTVDRIIILKYLNTTELGYYSLLLMTGLIFSGISEGIGEIVYPRMNQKYGETGNPKSLDFLLFIPGYIMTALLAIISVVVIFFLTYLVPIVLNEYSPGILSAIIFSIGTLVGGGSLLNTIDKQWYSLVVQFFALVINIFISIFLVQHSFGITGVAIGTVTSLIVYRLGVTLLSYYFIEINVVHAVKRIGALILPSIIVCLYYFLFNYQSEMLNNSRFYYHLVLSMVFLTVILTLLLKRLRLVLTRQVYSKYSINY